LYFTKTITIFLLLTSFVFSSEKIPQDVLEDYNFLEVAKNYNEVYEVHFEKSQAQKIIDRLNNINFSMTPYSAPIKPFDTLKIHHAYPLKIFLPNGTTVSKAILSNSSSQPSASENIVTVNVDDEFESGLLDIVYIIGDNEKQGNYISIKLDKYILKPNSEDLIDEKLYTQAIYYIPKKLSNIEVLSNLKPFEYELPHSQVEYMGVVYDVYLVSIVSELKTELRLKDDKFINSGFIFNGKKYNYFVKTGEVK